MCVFLHDAAVSENFLLFTPRYMMYIQIIVHTNDVFFLFSPLTLYIEVYGVHTNDLFFPFFFP